MSREPRVAVRAMTLLVVALCVFQALAFAFVALSRASYPFDLEWLEGFQLLQARELLVHGVLYPPAHADFVSLTYEPLHAIIVASCGKMFGLTYGVGRAVGIASTFALAGVSGFIVLRETRSRAYALVAAAGTFVLFPAGAFWLDLVRVDALFLAILLTALAIARARRGAAMPYICALLLYIAFLAKQIAPIYAPVVVVAIFRRRGARDAALFCGVFLALLLADGFIGNALTAGRYRFYTYTIPTAQPNQWNRVPLLVEALLPGCFALACVVAYSIARFRAARRATLFRRVLRAVDGWPLVTACGAIATALAFMHPGGALNDLLSAYVAVPAVVAIALHRASKLRTKLAHPIALAFIAAQLVVFLYDPRAQIPSSRARDAAARFTMFVRDTDGPVIVPEHPFVTVLAGKGSSYHTHALWEMSYSHEAPPDDLRERLRDEKYAMVVTALDPNTASKTLYPRELALHYVVASELDWAAPLECHIGLDRTQPKYVLRPRDH